MLISLMGGSLVWSNQHHQSGTLMPSGAVHTIFPDAERSEAIRNLRPSFKYRKQRDSGFALARAPE